MQADDLAAPARAAVPAADHVRAQHGRLITHLDSGQRFTRTELERACEVPSVTKRVCELIAAGWPIERARGYADSPHGRRRATFYRLTGPRRQRDLFEPNE